MAGNRSMKGVFVAIVVTTIILCVFVYGVRKTTKYYNRFLMEDGLKPKTSENLIHLAVRLARISHLTQSYEDRKSINSAFYEVKELVDQIQSTSADEFEYFEPGLTTPKETKNRILPEFHTLLTVVLNFVHYKSVNKELIEEVLTTVTDLYPSVVIVAAIPKDVTIRTFESATLNRYSTFTKETDVWNGLIAQVHTKYVYVGRGVTKLTKDSGLRRLLWTVTKLGISVASGATRSLHSGQWSDGCEQAVLKNFTLLYTRGYYMSLQSCLLCQHVSGPFLTYTNMFKLLPLESGMTMTSGAAIWFLEMSKRGKVIVSCPDSMTYVRDDVDQYERMAWFGLMAHYVVESIYLSSGDHFTYGCDEASSWCTRSMQHGMSLTHCCMRELSSAIRTIMKTCESNNMICELNDGTLLGTLKFEGILPWEIDADINIDRDNFTTFKTTAVPQLAKLGYKFSDDKTYYRLFTRMGWFIEIFPIGGVDSHKLREAGMTPTRILLDGQYVTTPESPGLFGRNRYGSEIYQHANHWRGEGGSTGWDFYSAGKFATCPKKGHHACLDQYIADGSLHFNALRDKG